ncbi:hypothetical protein HN747_01815 [archaeon]|jgi:putative membrane protein|nr:hypothetical protein [archaeon]
MIFQIIIAILLGFLLGCVTGLIPGIHTNLISIILLSLIGLTSTQIDPILLVALIVSMATTHTFLDFIPSIYLGAPDEDTALSVLPGHEFLLKGRAHEAIILTLIGSASAIILLLIIIPILFIILPFAIQYIERMMAWILIWISIFLVTDNKKRAGSILIFALAGFLGISTLGTSTNEPLLPLLTGLFGTSTILYSIKTATKIPIQTTKSLVFSFKETIKPLITTLLVSPICSFLPGLGSSQAAIIGSKITGKLDKRQFLILLGSINTLVLTVSFFTLYLIGKSRTGSANAISQLIQLTPSDLITISITIISVALLSIPLTIFISKQISKNIHKMNYSYISKITILILIAVTFIVSGFMGLLILLISTALGLLCTMIGVRKSLLMGCLLIPTILYYWPM